MKTNWLPPVNQYIIKTVDLHTEGEPLRIITDGLPDLPGSTILEKRRYFGENFDYLRTSLMYEPRGHADMYGAILTDPCTTDGDLGVIFMHNEGYSSMCGHGIIAVTKFVFESGLIKIESLNPELKIDTPAGRVVASAIIRDKFVEKVTFVNVPSFLYLENEIITVEGFGEVRFDVAFGGAFYAICNADESGLKLIPEEYCRLIDAGKRIKTAVEQNFPIRHPFEKDLGFLYGTIFTSAAKNSRNHSRNVCIFANGEVDRSPTGTGVSARAACHFAKDEMKTGETYTIESIIDTTMKVKITGRSTFGPYDAILPEVTGTAYFTGAHQFFFDPDDPLKKGFIFR